MKIIVESRPCEVIAKGFSPFEEIAEQSRPYKKKIRRLSALVKNCTKVIVTETSKENLWLQYTLNYSTLIVTLNSTFHTCS